MTFIKEWFRTFCTLTYRQTYIELVQVVADSSLMTQPCVIGV